MLARVSASMGVVSEVQPIIHRGVLVAIVIADEAIIADAVPTGDLAAVKAKCLYALEIAAGERPGPYTDAGAAAYVQAIARAHREYDTTVQEQSAGRAAEQRSERAGTPGEEHVDAGETPGNEDDAVDDELELAHDD